MVEILSILSSQIALVGMERFAKLKRQTLNEQMGTEFCKSTSDWTFRLVLVHIGVC